MSDTKVLAERIRHVDKKVDKHISSIDETLHRQEKKLDNLAALITNVALQQQTLDRHEADIKNLAKQMEEIKSMVTVDTEKNALIIKALDQQNDDKCSSKVLLEKILRYALPALVGAGSAISSVEIYLQ